MFFLRVIYIVFFAFFTSYQYAMKENNNEEEENKINAATWNNEQNNENNSGKETDEIPDFVKILKNEIEKYDDGKIEAEERNIYEKKAQLEKESEYLRDLDKIKDNEKYKQLEEYASGIKERVKEKYKEIDEEFESLKENKAFQRLMIKYHRANIVHLSKRKILKFVREGTEEFVEKLLRPEVMCDDKSFPDCFNKFKGYVDGIIKGVKLLKDPNSLEIEEKEYMFSIFAERDVGKPTLYKFFRNALYRQAYLLFNNTFRVISNVKIEYDLWRSDTRKHIWGVNSSANVYYKYRSSCDYRVFKFNLFYIEFSFGLFHRLLKPLKRISEWGCFPSSAGGDHYKKNGVNKSDVPFWEMINISLVQISVGPVGINGLRFSLFDPIFFIITLCFITYFSFDKVNYNGYAVLHELTEYRTPLGEKEYFDEIIEKNYQGKFKGYWDGELKDRQKEHEAYWEGLEKNRPKVYTIKIILEKIGLLAPPGESNNTLINKFRLYCLNNILFNIIETWKRPYHKGFYIVDIVFHTFARILKSAPKIFEEIPACGPKPRDTIHKMKIIETHYSNGAVYDPTYADKCGFRGRCDMFFLSIALLVYSMIDSISIDLRWFIENETVREYCVKLKRKVCRFFQR